MNVGLPFLTISLAIQMSRLHPPQLKELNAKVDATQRKLRVSDPQRRAFTDQIEAYWKKNTPIEQDVALAMLLVMMHRYDVRRLRSAPSLFDNQDDELDNEPAVVVAANDAVSEARRLQLFPVKTGHITTELKRYEQTAKCGSNSSTGGWSC